MLGEPRARQRDLDGPAVGVAARLLDETAVDELVDRAARPALVEPKSPSELRQRHRRLATELRENRAARRARPVAGEGGALRPDVESCDFSEQCRAALWSSTVSERIDRCHAQRCHPAESLSIATISTHHGGGARY